MSEVNSKQVAFTNVNKEKTKEDKNKDLEKSKKSEETDAYSNVDSIKQQAAKKKCNDAESETSVSHIKNIDLYDRLNFQRIQIKRSSVKYKTNICKAPKINIQKFTDEIYKYVEDIEPQQSTSGKNVRKRTIKFSTQKVTYQYPKIKEVITSNFSDLSSGIDETKEENEDKDKDKEEDKKGIFVFGDHNDEDDHSHGDVDHDSDKQHIDLANNYEEK